MHTRYRQLTARKRNHTQPHTRSAIFNLPSILAWHSVESRMQLVHPNPRPLIGERVGSRQVKVIPSRGAMILNTSSSESRMCSHCS